MGLVEKEAALIEQFQFLTTWEEKYRKIIELGKLMPDLPAELRREEFKVPGCQSQVWLVAEKLSDGTLHFRADSDALIAKGLVALLVNLYDGAAPSEILAFQPKWIAQMGLSQHLSPSRANGLVSMLKAIVIHAAQSRS